jgi:hypothetical protein
MNTTTERLIEIENERAQTMSDPSFQSWMKDLGVSIIYKDRDPIHKAQDMMRDYNFNKLFVKQSFISIFTL